MKHFVEEVQYRREINQSEDYDEPERVRSGIRHRLMDEAEQTGNEDLWLNIGQALVRAHGYDDLTTQVSDHFVRACPDSVFRKVALESPGTRFDRWRRRAIRLLSEGSA